jgi:D-lactate dehydrogenase
VSFETTSVLRNPDWRPSEGGGQAELLRSLRRIVGKRHLLTDPRRTRGYLRGFRYGGGDALAVIRPGTLLEQWRALELCVRANAIVIPQASNTSLTGGSTPAAGGYDRDVVVMNTRRLRGIHLLDGGRQVLCLPGATLHELERCLRPLGREPHSVIGSSCFGASVIGGICNNSGGALTRRGPAYTEMAAFAQVDADGELRLVNHLGIDLGDNPEEVLNRLQAGDFRSTDVQKLGRRGSAADYPSRVRDVDADTPARFNADPRHLFEASGSAGKLIVFAVRLDTFEAEPSTTTFYIGCDSPPDLSELRRSILTERASLPIAGEYLHRDAFDLADRYGKDQFLLIEWLGTARLPLFYALLNCLEGLLARIPRLSPDLVQRLLFRLGHVLPDHLPPRLRLWRARYPHHLLLKVSGTAAEGMRAHLTRWQSRSRGWFECTTKEARKAFLHRFVVAGAAVRYRAVRPSETAGIVALDIALRRNDHEWFETLPPEIDAAILHKIYYGHFLCHVLHQDYVVKPGADCAAIEQSMRSLLGARGARYPAEHNVGHAYPAEPALADFYRGLDPGNRLNPGIGQMSKKSNYD